MMLVQDNMFSLPEVVADFTQAQPSTDAKPFDMVLWGKTIGGQWEQVQAATKAAVEAAKGGAQ